MRATPVDLRPLVERIEGRGTPRAQALAGFLRTHATGTGLVQRERYLIVGAYDEDQLADRVRSIEDSLSRTGLQPQRLRDESRAEHGLPDLVHRCWSGREATGTAVGPANLRIEPQSVSTDGQNCRTLVLSAWPCAVHTDWLGQLLDGPLPIDVALHIEPLDTEQMCSRLDAKLRQYNSSPPSAARDTAIEDAESLRRALERRREHALSVGVYFLVRAVDPKELTTARSACGKSFESWVAKPRSRVRSTQQDSRHVFRWVTTDCAGVLSWIRARWLARIQRAAAHWCWMAAFRGA